MISEKEYKETSNRVYKTNPKLLQYNPNLKEGATTEFNSVKYKILDVEHESKNGMQAMAVAQSLAVQRFAD